METFIGQDEIKYLLYAIMIAGQKIWQTDVPTNYNTG